MLGSGAVGSKVRRHLIDPLGRRSMPIREVRDQPGPPLCLGLVGTYRRAADRDISRQGAEYGDGCLTLSPREARVIADQLRAYADLVEPT
ncbi:hypothetical protein [Rhodococcus tukisamuensis]|uniref:Uncharacterized protein n=1 Tax=Rhodococcus tukisamuensis TaxID=168276 RepID=A0A1G7A7E6_9NOCA|nr:hypothetical protein [Rhodococcus tukisamuensis]SDE10749.1 hypothetical protein SAMN05444580_11077 [Rhodococcus tukisamuensis]